MRTTTMDTHTNSVEFDFVKGHIAATMTLIHALIDQGVIDREQLDVFFASFILAVKKAGRCRNEKWAVYKAGALPQQELVNIKSVGAAAARNGKYKKRGRCRREQRKV